MNDCVLVSGANGYLGSYVVRQFLKNHFNVIAIKYRHFASVIVDHPNVQYIEADIAEPLVDKPALLSALQSSPIYAIVNAAALLGSSDYEANLRVNAMGVQHLIDLAHRIGCRRFIQISSVVVLKRIKGPYGITKQKGQEILAESDLDYTIFIPAMILGPESLGLNRVLKNVFRLPGIVPLIGSGRETQHPIYVKDFAWVIVAAARSEKTRRKVYEIAGETILSFKDFVRMILEFYGKKRIFVPIPAAIALLLGKIFQKIQKVPLFTAEHVKGILQDSILNPAQLRDDLSFQPTPLKHALAESLRVIGTNWGYYLGHREERVIKLEEAVSA